MRKISKAGARVLESYDCSIQFKQEYVLIRCHRCSGLTIKAREYSSKYNKGRKNSCNYSVINDDDYNKIMTLF